MREKVNFRTSVNFKSEDDRNERIWELSVGQGDGYWVSRVGSLVSLKVDENMKWKTGSPGGRIDCERLPGLLKRGVLRNWDVTRVYFDQDSHSYEHGLGRKTWFRGTRQLWSECEWVSGLLSMQLSFPKFWGLDDFLSCYHCEDPGPWKYPFWSQWSCDIPMELTVASVFCEEARRDSLKACCIAKGKEELFMTVCVVKGCTSYTFKNCFHGVCLIFLIPYLPKEY